MVSMLIRVEFFGVARLRAGVVSAEINLAGAAVLGDVIQELRSRFPELAAECFSGNRPRDGYTANIGGTRFVSDPATPLADGDALLILSADAGG